MANAPAPSRVYDSSDTLIYSGKQFKFTGSGVSVAELSGKAIITISGGGVTDHGALTGLSDDDHSQYHTDSRALTWLGTRSTSDLAEGTNLYYTSSRFNTAFAAKSTSDLAEGTNLYFTNARAVSALNGCNVSMFTNDAGYLTAMGALDALSDVNASTPSNGDVLTWDSGSSLWIAAPAGAASQTPWASNIDGAGYYLCNATIYDANGMGPYKSIDPLYRTLHDTTGATKFDWSCTNKFIFAQDISSAFELQYCNMPSSIKFTDGTNNFFEANMYMPFMTNVCRMQFGELYLNDSNFNNKITFDDGYCAAVSGTNQGAFRYNCTANRFEQSLNGGSWTSFGGSPAGACTQIQFHDPMTSTFCAVSGFRYANNVFEVWECGDNDPSTKAHIGRNGLIDTFYKSDGMSASCVFQFGYFPDITPYWGLNSCPAGTTYMVNQYLRFTDYCTKWGNDDAYWEITDTDNSLMGKFMCGLEISHTSSSWSIDYCSMEPNRIRINKSWYLPECGPTTGQVLGYCSMTGQPEWITGGGGGGSSCGSDTWIQMADSFGGFAASCNFRYDYSFNYLEMRGNATCELLRVDHRSAGGGWVVDVTNDTCGYGCDLTVRLGNDGMSNYRRFRIDNYCYSDDWIDFSPYNHMMRVNYYDGMSCAVISEFGYDESNSATVMRNCCFGKFEIGECNIDRMKWTFATYNDFMKLEDCIVSYGGCCNFQFLINNGCTNGYNEWVGDNGLGLVISSSSSCCLHPFILAQGLVERARFDSSGMFVVTADTNLAGTNLCVLGNATYNGTFDPNTISSITVVNGMITAVV